MFFRKYSALWLWSAAFVSLSIGFAMIAPNNEIACVGIIILLTIVLFVSEIIDIDVTAILILVLLGLSELFAPIIGLPEGVVNNRHLFDGFSSQAVMAIIAVMILGAGLDKTGVMSRVANWILSKAGTSQRKVRLLLSLLVASLSSFVQNIGTAALFIPVSARIAARTNIPLSNLLMPVGFCAILGGTVTMIGSSTLIVLNDLISNSNLHLPEQLQMPTWSLFSVTPIGISLAIVGILYFYYFGERLLPSTQHERPLDATSTMEYFEQLYGIDKGVFEVVIPDQCDLIGSLLGNIENQYRFRAIGVKYSGQSSRVGAGAVSYDSPIEPGMVLAIIAKDEHLQSFITSHGLKKREVMRSFADLLSPLKSGIAEVIIPPNSRLLGKTAREERLRQRFGFSLIAIHRNNKTIRQGDNIRNMPLQVGDVLIGHTQWNNLAHLQKDSNFIIITSEFPHEEVDVRTDKVKIACVFFMLSLLLAIFSTIPVAIALLFGALGMILSRVLTMEEAYRAISWKTIFLLAGLIPLGIASETSGLASWLALQATEFMAGASIWQLQLGIALLASLFSLVISNVGATILLVPIAINIALGVEDARPEVFALTVAIAAANSFIIPTNQVNALIKAPAGYSVNDFIRVGSGMSLLFLMVLVLCLNTFYN